MVERGAEQTDSRSIDGTHEGLRIGPDPELIPEGKCPHQDEHPWKKNSGEAEKCARHTMGCRGGDGAEVGREAEQRTRDRLRGAIARKEDVITDPPGCHECFAQQRQYHMASAEYQCARSIE